MSQVQKAAKPRLYRFNARQYGLMDRAGVFGGDRVELLNGCVVRKMTQYPPHVHAVIMLANLLRDLLPRTDWALREEKPLRLGRSWLPEPDIAVARGPQADYAGRIPTGADVAMLVEVSDTSYAEDVGVRRRHYEKCGIPTYWVVDLQRRRVEVSQRRQGAFEESVVFADTDDVPAILDGREYGRVRVSDLLIPPPPPRSTH